MSCIEIILVRSKENEWTCDQNSYQHTPSTSFENMFFYQKVISGNAHGTVRKAIIPQLVNLLFNFLGLVRALYFINIPNVGKIEFYTDHTMVRKTKVLLYPKALNSEKLLAGNSIDFANHLQHNENYYNS